MEDEYEENRRDALDDEREKRARAEVQAHLDSERQDWEDAATVEGFRDRLRTVLESKPIQDQLAAIVKKATDGLHDALQSGVEASIYDDVAWNMARKAESIAETLISKVLAGDQSAVEKVFQLHSFYLDPSRPYTAFLSDGKKLRMQLVESCKEQLGAFINQEMAVTVLAQAKEIEELRRSLDRRSFY